MTCFRVALAIATASRLFEAGEAGVLGDDHLATVIYKTVNRAFC